MKILVIGMDGLLPEVLYGEDPIAEQLVNFHRMMEMGCYGPLEIAEGLGSEKEPALRDLSIWDKAPIIIPSMVDQGKDLSDEKSIYDQIVVSARSCFELIIAGLNTEDWDYFEYNDTGLELLYTTFQTLSKEEDWTAKNQLLVSTVRDYYLFLNEQLGRLFEAINQDLVISVISRNGPNKKGSGFFILTSPNNPMEGEIAGASLFDLYSTLLELSGKAIPDSVSGKSIVAGKLTEQSLDELTQAEEDILRERLSGLGYIS